MKTKYFLREHSACKDGARWALSISGDMADVWDELIKQEKYDWLLWTLSRPGVFPESVLRKLACKFVRETPLMNDLVVWDLLTDERSRKAVEVAEAYADGKATDEELHAARASAYDAVHAARAATYVADAAAYVVYAADAAYDAADAAADAAYDAADAAADAAYYAADAAADAAAYVAASAAADAAADAAARSERREAARAHAKAAQIKTIAKVANPFRKRAKQ